MRPCIEPGCPNLTQRTRCATHEAYRRQRRGSPTERGYDAAYQRRRRDLLQLWVSEHGWVCPGYDVRPHPSRDLTADHVIPMAQGGKDGPLAVLCRSCNSRRGQAQQHGTMKASREP